MAGRQITISVPFLCSSPKMSAMCQPLQMNVFLCAFNLLVPAYPLDGGRILVGALLTAGVQVGQRRGVRWCVRLRNALSLVDAHVCGQAGQRRGALVCAPVQCSVIG